MPMPRGKRAESKTPTVDYAAGCLVRSTSTKCTTKKSRKSSSPPISRPENAWASRPLSRRSSRSLAKTCKSGSHSPVALGSRIQEGWIAEVVSDFEYDKAIKNGIPGHKLIYNGPHKSKAILRRALTEGALVQIDNWDELEAVEDILDQVGHSVEVGIRTWMDNRYLQQCWTKFGFALDNGEAARAAMRIIANPKLRLHTLT